MIFDDPALFERAAEQLLKHLVHKITITPYGGDAAPDNIAVECEDCHATLIDFSPEPEDRSITEKHASPLELARLELVTEMHCADGDAGAYDDLDVRHLWTHFAKSHAPSHILIRPNTEQGQQLSNNLFNAGKIAAALNSFVDTINATGGVARSDDGSVAPVADKDWYDLGHAYTIACEALGMKPQVSD